MIGLGKKYTSRSNVIPRRDNPLVWKGARIHKFWDIYFGDCPTPLCLPPSKSQPPTPFFCHPYPLLLPSTSRVTHPKNLINAFITQPKMDILESVCILRICISYEKPYSKKSICVPIFIPTSYMYTSLNKYRRQTL